MINLNTIEYHRTDTWPSITELENESNDIVAEFIEKIFRHGVFKEIDRIMTCNNFPKCGGIGHIVLISICCAIDSLSAYASGGGKVGNRFTNFIAKYFPNKYSGKEEKIYKAFRCDSVHGWNLQNSTISGNAKDPKHLSEPSGIIYISLYDFFNDLIKAFNNYLSDLKKDDDICNNLLKRYKNIKKDI